MLKLKELLEIQNEFTKSIKYEPNASQYVFALNIEISELLNTLPWKWWKRDQVIDKDKTIEELADVLAFWLSWYNLYFKNNRSTVILPVEQLVERSIATLEHAIMYGMQQNSGDPHNDLNNIHYEDNYTMVQTEASGRRLGKLIGVVMRMTGATLEEIIQAYKEKMEVNWKRQTNGY